MKSPIIHFFGAILICGIVIVVYGFCYTAISNKSREVSVLQNQIATATETTSRITHARTALSEITDDEAKIQSYFVSETAAVALINDLETLGSENGTSVSISSVSTGGSSAQPSLLLSLTIKGTFEAVMKTIGIIEYAPYAISISSVSVEKDAKDIWHADLNMVVGSLPAGTKTTTP